MKPFCRVVSVFPVLTGGILNAGFASLIRTQTLLASGLPGIMAAPGKRRANASSFRSRRKPAWRMAGSGPWHLKQLSDRIGRMSRLKSRADESSLGCAKLNTAPIAIPGKIRSADGKRVLETLNGKTNLFTVTYPEYQMLSRRWSIILIVLYTPWYKERPTFAARHENCNRNYRVH